MVLAGEDEVGADVGERREDEPPLVQARVGDDELVVAEDEIARVEDVEVEGARGVARTFRRTTKLGLDALQPVEQRDRLAVEFDFEHGIQIRTRVRPRADRFGFINPRAEHRSGHARQPEDALAGEPELREAVAEIRAERDAGPHGKG